jgi:SNF family Na+-dependent transporter
MIIVPIPFILVCIISSYYVSVNNAVEGKGLGYYFGTENVPLAAPSADGSIYYDASLYRDKLAVDAINMAFFSIGVCVSVFYSYGSYNDLKKPVIADAFLIAFLDFIFSIGAGLASWSVIGYLQATDNAAFS